MAQHRVQLYRCPNHGLIEHVDRGQIIVGEDGQPFGRQLRRSRIAREEAEIRADLDHGRT